MLTEDFQRFEAVVRKLEGIYGKKIDDPTMQAWWGALRDLPFELIRERVDSHIRFGKFFPKPADIRPKEDRPKEHDAGWEAFKRRYDSDSNRRLDALWVTDRAEWLRQVSPKIYESGHLKGMSDAQIAQKLAAYTPIWQ